VIQNRINDIGGIIFDFDFTLADSSKGVVKCVNYALKKLNFSEFADEEIKKTIGLSLDQTFIKLTGKLYLDKIEKFKYHFIEKADEVMTNNTKLFTETPSVIKFLHSKSIKLGIVSTKFRYRIKNILSREALLDYFDVIIGGEDVQSLKPNPIGLLEAIKELNLSISQIIYIGDSVIDAETARRGGISFVAVLSGVTPRKMFSRYQVREYLNNISELPKLLCIT
jgi:phosphoglycolate phosphatase